MYPPIRTKILNIQLCIWHPPIQRPFTRDSCSSPPADVWGRTRLAGRCVGDFGGPCCRLIGRDALGEADAEMSSVEVASSFISAWGCSPRLVWGRVREAGLLFSETISRSCGERLWGLTMHLSRGRDGSPTVLGRSLGRVRPGGSMFIVTAGLTIYVLSFPVVASGWWEVPGVWVASGLEENAVFNGWCSARTRGLANGSGLGTSLVGNTLIRLDWLALAGAGVLAEIRICSLLDKSGIVSDH